MQNAVGENEQQLQVYWTWSSLAINISCSVHYDNDNHNVDWTWFRMAAHQSSDQALQCSERCCGSFCAEVQCNNKQCNAMQYNAVKCNAMQHSALLAKVLWLPPITAHCFRPQWVTPISLCFNATQCNALSSEQCNVSKCSVQCVQC